jgi:A/G-specific adenine glycosylase
MFPWRIPALVPRIDGSLDPYHVLVAEIMLQQTQAGDRTISKYISFVKRFPSFEVLSKARLRTVLSYWQGLGYNRRAKYLKELSIVVVKKYSSVLPSDSGKLQNLPGIGPYTAGAIQAFAFNIPALFLETNIRTAFIHHFFTGENKVGDKEIMPLMIMTMDYENPRMWYEALMDYGAMLKKTIGNANRRSDVYVKQKAFKGSNREIRGFILKFLLTEKSNTEEDVIRALKKNPKRIKEQLSKLVSEGLVVQREKKVLIA